MSEVNVRRAKAAVVAGIDVGTRSTKAALFDPERGEIVGRATVATGHNLPRAAELALQGALDRSGTGGAEVVYVASTGYGRYQVPFRDVPITEITCHARGAHHLYPATGCVLDVGAQNARAMRIGEGGRVLAFRMNDKCASGAGRFLERVARALELDLEEIGPASLRATDPKPISSICAVLAESEVINQVTEGRRIEDILMGTHHSIAERIVTLLKQVGVVPEVTLTGGVSQNAGMALAFREKIAAPLNLGPDSPYAGAIGAALLGSTRLRRAPVVG